MPRDADRALKAEFARELRSAYKAAKKKGEVRNADEFAKTLGMRRANLYKYFRARSRPTPEVLRRALSKWAVVAHYGGLELNESAFGGAADRPAGVPATQLLLPLAIRKLTQNDIAVEVGPKKPNAIELRLKIRFG